VKRFAGVLLVAMILCSCGGPSPEAVWIQTAKYKVVVHGPYNPWNGGEEWSYYCDSYTYDNAEHYILKDSSGTVMADFTRRPTDRVEIMPNPHRQ